MSYCRCGSFANGYESDLYIYPNIQGKIVCIRCGGPPSNPTPEQIAEWSREFDTPQEVLSYIEQSGLVVPQFAISRLKKEASL